MGDRPADHHELTACGRHRWAFAAGHLPDGSTGREPAMTSRDELCVLNSGAEDATLQVTVVHHDRPPVGPYEVRVPARRVCAVRLTDVMDPGPIPLGVPYGLVVDSDRPVVVQLRHLDTRQEALAVAVASGVADGP